MITMMTTNEEQSHYPRSAQPYLEDILADPNTNWSDIRNAIKAHGRSACTNAAVINALSRRKSSIEDLNDHSRPSTVKSVTVDHNTFDQSSEESEEDDISYNEYKDVPVILSTAGANSLNKPTRRQSHRPSIDIMNFGVDNFVDLDDSDESVNYESHFCHRRESTASLYSCDSDGFMGWKKDIDDDSVESDSIILSQGCVSEGLKAKNKLEVTSKEVEDKDGGFLAWEMDASTRVSNLFAKELANVLQLGSEEEEDDGCKIEALKGTDPDIKDKDCDAEDPFMPWEMSASARVSKLYAAEIASALHFDSEGEEGCETEDELEGTDPGFVPWEMSASARVSKLFAAEIASALHSDIEENESSEEPDCTGTAVSHEESRTKHFDTVPKSLFSFRQSSAGSSFSENDDVCSNTKGNVPIWKKFSRRISMQPKPPQTQSFSDPAELGDVKQAIMKLRANANRRGCKTNESVQRQFQGTTDESYTIMIPMSPETKRTRIKKAESRGSWSSLSDLLSIGTDNSSRRYERKSCRTSFWDSANDDTREAIWINSLDGGFDIEKECRKLYQDQDDCSSCFSMGNGL